MGKTRSAKPKQNLKMLKPHSLNPKPKPPKLQEMQPTPARPWKKPSPNSQLLASPQTFSRRPAKPIRGPRKWKDSWMRSAEQQPATPVPSTITRPHAQRHRLGSVFQMVVQDIS